MSATIFKAIRIQVLLLLVSTAAFGQFFVFGESNNMTYNGVITGQDFALYFETQPQSGLFSLSLRDSEFTEQMYEQFTIGRNFGIIGHDVVGDTVHLMLSNASSFKLMCVVDTKTHAIKFFPINVNAERIEHFKVVDNTLLVVGWLPKGDLVQLFDYRTSTLISLSELYHPKTRVWDVQVKDGIFDILVYYKGDFINQSLKMLGYNASGTKMYETVIEPPGQKKLIFKSGKLVSTSESSYTIVGTYAKKQGEQFSGYYQVSVNDFMEQVAKLHPMRELEGFFDFKRNPGLRKGARNLRREMVVYHTKTNADYIALASSSDRVVRKFVHFVLLNHQGERIYDTSVKVFYHSGWALEDQSMLALVDKELYFVFEGNEKMNVLPGMKLYQIEDGNLTGLLKINDFLNTQLNQNGWEEVKVYHWKENKFVVMGIENINGVPRYVLKKIEV